MENKRLGGRPQSRLAVEIWRILKWIVIYFSIGCALGVALFLGLIAYLSRNTCDDTVPSPVVRNSRGDTAEGQVQVCTWIGTVVNNYITIQIHEPTRIWPKKTLIDYDPAGPGRAPVLRWIDDNSLSVDLGKFCGFHRTQIELETSILFIPIQKSTCRHKTSWQIGL